MTTPRQALDRLRTAADSGALDALCQRFEVRLVTVFGSAVHDAAHADDLDLGVMFEPDADGDIVGLTSALIELTGTDALDVMDAQRASPTARARAIVEALALYESEAGAYAQAQMGAAVLEWDTQWMRRMALDSLAR